MINRTSSLVKFARILCVPAAVAAFSLAQEPATPATPIKPAVDAMKQDAVKEVAKVVAAQPTENAKHEARLAKMDQIATVAKAQKDDATVAQVGELRTVETKRHEAVVAASKKATDETVKGADHKDGAKEMEKHGKDGAEHGRGKGGEAHGKGKDAEHGKDGAEHGKGKVEVGGVKEPATKDMPKVKPEGDAKTEVKAEAMKKVAEVSAVTADNYKAEFEALKKEIAADKG